MNHFLMSPLYLLMDKGNYLRRFKGPPPKKAAKHVMRKSESSRVAVHWALAQNVTL